MTNLIGRRSLVALAAATAAGCAARSGGGRAEAGGLRIAPIPGAPSHARSEGPAGGTRPTFSQLLERAPPLDVSLELDSRDRAELKSLAQALAPLYELLGRAWDMAPLDCPLAEARCLPAWERAFGPIKDLESVNRAPDCERFRSDCTARNARERAHARFIARQLTTLLADLRAAAGAHGASVAFEELSVGPAPSWDRECPGPSYRFETTVPFGAGDASLSPFALQTLEGMRDALETIPPVVRLEVRGHADPRERGDARALSSRRAEAVAGWLEKNASFAGRALIVVALGAALPIETSATAEGRAQNRRVDFQPV